MDLAPSRGDLKREMFLDPAGVFQLFGVAENAVERGKKLLGGQLFFVVGLGNFEHEENTVDVENLEAISFFVIAISEEGENGNDWYPNYGHKDKVKDLHGGILS